MRLPQLKAKTLRELDLEKLRQNLFDLRSELSKLRANAARGLIKKDTGKIRKLRRDIARILTVMREKGVKE